MGSRLWQASENYAIDFSKSPKALSAAAFEGAGIECGGLSCGKILYRSQSQLFCHIQVVLSGDEHNQEWHVAVKPRIFATQRIEHHLSRTLTDRKPRSY